MRRIDGFADILGEKRLLLAIVERAILDAFGNRLRPEDWEDDEYPVAWKREALLWLESPDDRPFSFLWCCDQLDLCPIRVRRIMKGGAPRKVRKTEGLIVACLSSDDVYQTIEFPPRITA